MKEYAVRPVGRGAKEEEAAAANLFSVVALE